MRSKFIPQMAIGAVPIAEIEFDVFNRHELVPILMALQHLYVNRPLVLEEICTLIKADITGQTNPKLGCKGGSATGRFWYSRPCGWEPTWTMTN